MSNEVINPFSRYEDDAGTPLDAGTLTFNTNLTTTLSTVYSDEALTTAQANPYTLDAFGRVTGDVRFKGVKRVVVKNKHGAVIRTLDNVTSGAVSLGSQKLYQPVADYATLRALTSADILDGAIIPVTNDGIAGQFVVKTGTVTDNGGTLIVFTDDSNRYVERAGVTYYDPMWFEATGDGTADDRTSLFNADAVGPVRVSTTHAIASGLT